MTPRPGAWRGSESRPLCTPGSAHNWFKHALQQTDLGLRFFV